jgi:NADPH:quinone reductase and related Zn-dependent oxidoreductases
MSAQKAIIITSKGHSTLVSDRPIPKAHDDFIVVKAIAVALNPTDWKHIDLFAPLDVIVGCDYAGIIEDIGPDVSARKGFKKGDKVFGVTHGSDAYNKENGAFAEHILAKGDLANKIPENLSFEKASTLPLGLCTVFHGLYLAMGLARPDKPLSEKEKKFVLIYGGSTATGSLGIQLAKL